MMNHGFSQFLTLFADFLNHFIFCSSDFWNKGLLDCEFTSFHLSCCLVLKLNDLHSVNIGLFDQYFRLAGKSVLLQQTSHNFRLFNSCLFCLRYKAPFTSIVLFT